MKSNEKIYTFFVLCFFFVLVFWLTEGCRKKKDVAHFPQGCWKNEIDIFAQTPENTAIKLTFLSAKKAELELIRNENERLRIPVQIEFLYDELFAIHLDDYKEQQLLRFLAPTNLSLVKKETRMYFSYSPKNKLKLAWKLPEEMGNFGQEMIFFLPE